MHNRSVSAAVRRTHPSEPLGRCFLSTLPGYSSPPCPKAQRAGALRRASVLESHDGGRRLQRHPVTFYLPGENDLERLGSLDPDRDWDEFVRGEHAWILQTYLRLRQAGHPVVLRGEPPAEGFVVYHAKHARSLLRRAHRLGHAVLVGVRADNSEPASADFEVNQNSVYADGKRRFHVPHWPQPGLLPRDPRRGSRIERVEFKGFLANLAPEFRHPDWAQWLAQRNLQWRVDAVEWKHLAWSRERLTWNDFRETDLLLAVRPGDPSGYTHKPATKLYNAWHAAVPALLGREPAFRELRRDPLDYLEVSSLEEAKAAVDLLLAEPDRYQRMIDHGRARAAEFTTEIVLARWVELLWQELPPVARRRPLQHLPLLLRPLVRQAQRLLAGRPLR